MTDNTPDETPVGDTAGLLDLSFTDRDGRVVPVHVTPPTREQIETYRERAEAWGRAMAEEVLAYKPTADDQAILTGEDPRPEALRGWGDAEAPGAAPYRDHPISVHTGNPNLDNLVGWLTRDGGSYTLTPEEAFGDSAHVWVDAIEATGGAEAFNPQWQVHGPGTFDLTARPAWTRRHTVGLLLMLVVGALAAWIILSAGR
jgi:hypothetical protein